MAGLLDPLNQYRGLLQANRQANVPGSGLLGMAQNRLRADERNPRPWLDKAAMATMPIPVVGDVLGAASDVAHYAANEEARTPLNFGLSALGLLPFIPGITAFHGSPHRINNVDEANPHGKFDLSKIGTGEGAQAYGHGIYLAENPGVAKSYQTQLSGFIASQNAKDAILDAAGGDENIYSEVVGLMQDGADMAHEAKWAREKGANWWTTDIRKKYISAYEEAAKHSSEQSGHFYTVDLPDEHIEKMLDWDAPLSEQPEAVREALKGIGETPGDYEEAIKVWEKQLVGIPDGPRSEVRKKMAQERISELTRAKDRAEIMTGGELYERIKGLRGVESASAASERLRELGIPGIRYLDGGSRSKGEGTRNFVIFDPEIAKILKRE